MNWLFGIKMSRADEYRGNRYGLIALKVAIILTREALQGLSNGLCETQLKLPGSHVLHEDLKCRVIFIVSPFASSHKTWMGSRVAKRRGCQGRNETPHAPVLACQYCSTSRL